MYVLLFSNNNHSILLGNQRKADQNQLLVWDYHVVLQVQVDADYWVYDFDTRLAFPCLLTNYLNRTFPDQSFLPDIYRTSVRKIPAKAFLRRFSSSRSHMVGEIRVNQFPDYPAIRADASRYPIPLSDYWDMHKKLNDGSQIFELESFRARISSEE